MSEFKIGSYEIATSEIYNTLTNGQITSDEELQQLDANGDYIISEDEYVDATDLVEDNTGDEEESESDDDDSSDTTVEEQIAAIEEELETNLLACYEELDQLKEQRLNIYNQMGTAADSDTYNSYLEQADSITDQISDVKDSIVKLMVTAEEEISSLESSSSLTTSDGEYTVSTGDTTAVTVADVSFDFTENLSERQESELELFKANWEENKSRYQTVAAATGVPAELIAAIHWREASGNFNARLQDGGSLSGYSSWEESAIDALSGNYGTIDVNDITTWYDFAERYNGLGYRNRGVSSPYVWAGTTNYTSGKYVADGVYDASYVDGQLGVAVMLKALLG